jgi:hypothetical protein
MKTHKNKILEKKILSFASEENANFCSIRSRPDLHLNCLWGKERVRDKKNCEFSAEKKKKSIKFKRRWNEKGKKKLRGWFNWVKTSNLHISKYYLPVSFIIPYLLQKINNSDGDLGDLRGLISQNYLKASTTFPWFLELSIYLRKINSSDGDLV